MPNSTPLILLTNDDGIESPGIWAAAETLADLGEVWVVAPREQSTSAARSHPVASDFRIQKRVHTIHGQAWDGYDVGGSPAQAVHFAMLKILPRRPDLIISGINYGANTGYDITRSGTIGAALEGANYGVRAMAISLETSNDETFQHSPHIDFSAAAYFARFFAERLLKTTPEADVHVLKVEVPADATPDTPWEVARLTPSSLYLVDLSETDRLAWRIQTEPCAFPPGSDSHTVFTKRHVAVTPLSMDLTSRTDLGRFEEKLRATR